MTDPSNTSTTAQFGAGEREEKTKLVYVKRWRTIVRLPEQYADEIVEALRAAAVSHTSVKDGGGPQCACMRGGYPIGNCFECDDPAARDAVADGAREKLASDAPVWMSATAAGAWADGYNACLEALRSAPVKAVGSEALREALSQISATLKYSRIAREEAALMVQQIILDALAHPGSGDAEPGARDDIVDLLRDPSREATREDAVAEILRLRGVLEELAVGFDRACSAATYTAEAQRLNKCAEFCRTAQTTNNGVSP